MSPPETALAVSPLHGERRAVTKGPQFVIYIAKTEWLDRKQVVFGLLLTVDSREEMDG